MKKNFALVLLINTVSIFSSNSEYVRQLINQHGGGRKSTFLHALRLMEERNVRVIVETGTSRGGELAFLGDGGFTIFFGRWASLNNAQLYSVDIDARAVKRAKRVTFEFAHAVNFFQDDSVNFLKNFTKQIDFLYLDSFDFDKNNPTPSQEHHVKEIEAAYDKLAPHSIVMIDDCGLPHGGKGKLVIPYLLERGWKIVANGYQVIMVRV